MVEGCGGEAEAQDFLVKMGSNPYREGKHCFSLVICGFWTNNAPYSATLSCTIFCTLCLINITFKVLPIVSNL